MSRTISSELENMLWSFLDFSSVCLQSLLDVIERQRQERQTIEEQETIEERETIFTVIEGRAGGETIEERETIFTVIEGRAGDEQHGFNVDAMLNVEAMPDPLAQPVSRDRVPIPVPLQGRAGDSQQWLHAEAMPDPSHVQPVRRAQRYYAVAIGRNPGIYESWNEAARQVNGYGGNIHRAFTNRADAEIFMQQNTPILGIEQTGRMGVDKFFM